MEQKGTFEMIDPKAYAQRQLDAGAQVVTAMKVATTGSVLARPAVEGEQLEVWTKDGNFEGYETTHEGQMVVTRADERGNPVIDQYGHTNTWSIEGDEFRKLYDADHPDPETGLYKPNGVVKTFVQVGKDVSLEAPWGEVQNIRKGGYLNISDMNKIYGIAHDELHETHEIIESHGRDCLAPQSGRRLPEVPGATGPEAQGQFGE